MDAKVCQRSLAKLNCPSETAPDGFSDVTFAVVVVNRDSPVETFRV